MKTYIIKNEVLEVEILDVGATIVEFRYLPYKRNIVLRHESLDDYLTNNNRGYFGSTVGRYGNRIKNAEFTIDNVVYHTDKNYLGKHTLHGGNIGINHRVFEVVNQTPTSIDFKYFSKDGEEGFPGNLNLIVSYSLVEDSLILEYKGEVDKKCPLNIINHSYFNLNGEGTILDHKLHLQASKILEVDSELIASGKFLNILNTPFDFNSEKAISEFFALDPNGIDHHFVLDSNKFTLKGKDLLLEVETTYPGVQLYADMYVEPFENGAYKRIKNQGLAIETQYEIDAFNNGVRDVIFDKDKKYFAKTIYTLKKCANI
jgi:aldose 1-epimerase